MKNLEYVKREIIKDDDDNVVEVKEISREPIIIKDLNGEEQNVQVKDTMDTETYFALTTLTDDNKAVEMKKQGFFMINKLVINPKPSDNLINKLPWTDTMKLIKALREEFLPEDAFLELGVPLEDLSPE